MSIRSEKSGPVTTIVLSRAEKKNAVDGPTAAALADAFRAFEADLDARACVLFGEGGTFCAGADLKAMGTAAMNRLETDGDGPMGPSRMHFKKPTIAAVSGFAVAGGLELALLCDLRVCEEDATLGVFCRRWGVPLIDGGTVRLPRIVGFGRALDLILTGRAVSAEEALAIGLVNRVVKKGEARAAAEQLASEIAALPQMCMLSDRKSAYASLDASFDDAMAREFALGMQTLRAGDALAGAARFAKGEGRHGAPATAHAPSAAQAAYATGVAPATSSTPAKPKI